MPSSIHVVSSSINFPWCQCGDYFPNQVASTKILVTMAPKVVAAWRVGQTKLIVGVHIKHVSAVRLGSTIT